MEIELRPYQQKCVDIINNMKNGSHLVQMATGLGKTVTFASIKRQGRVLILSHRDELVHQPQKYYDCSFGIEQAAECSNGEEVVSAGVQSIVRRLKRFNPDDFDMIITDEAHHAIAPTYKKIYDYFKPRIHIGFTATPKRGDKVRLDTVFDDIIFQRDLKWGIDNKYLSDIKCLQADIGFDISKVKKKMGDFDIKQLSQAINQEKMNAGIAEAYYQLAGGTQTLIFAADVSHANNIAEQIKGSVVVTGETKNRQKIIEAFTRREIKCLINCMVFTEGTDMPLIETIIIARPTANATLYTQMVGRGLRLYEGKPYLTLIDCVGLSGKHKLCTAPTLLGLDDSSVPEQKKKHIIGMLSEMQNTIKKMLDTPDAWIINTREIKLFEMENNLNLHNLNWKMDCDGSFICNSGEKEVLIVEPINKLGRSSLLCKPNDHAAERVILKDVPIQAIFDYAFDYMVEKHNSSRKLWDMEIVRLWGNSPASQSQIKYIKTLLTQKRNIEKYHCEDYDASDLSKYEASIIIDRILSNK